MIQVNDTLDFLITVRSTIQPCRQERLAGGEHLQVIGRAVFHQQFSVVNCCLQMLHLFLVQPDTFTGGLPLDKSVIHFFSGIEQRLTECEQGFFLLCLRCFQIGNVLPTIEYRLY